LPDDPTLERPDDPNDTAKLKAVLLLVAAVAFAVVPFFTDPFTGFGPDRFPVPVDDPPIQPAGLGLRDLGGDLPLAAGLGGLRPDQARHRIRAGTRPAGR
jgi:hypothetical protein